jgi:arsenate reductase
MTLGRRALGEALGTGMLVMAVVGSGIAATNYTDDSGLQLLANAFATVGALVALILAFGAVSGAHFNPLVSVLACLRGELPWRDAFPYAAAQVLGALGGTATANSMFGLDPFTASSTVREGGGVWLGEFVATVSLLLLVTLVGRGGDRGRTAVAVGVWIGGAYWFTSSTSLANPAVTAARSLTDSFSGIAPGSVPAFLLVQILALPAAATLTAFLAPRRSVAVDPESTDSSL